MGNSCGLTRRGLALEVIRGFQRDRPNRQTAVAEHRGIGPSRFIPKCFSYHRYSFSGSPALKNRPPSPIALAIYSSLGVAGGAAALSDETLSSNKRGHFLGSRTRLCLNMSGY